MNRSQIDNFLHLFLWEVSDHGDYTGSFKEDSSYNIIVTLGDNEITVTCSWLVMTSYQEWADRKWRDYEFRCGLKWTTPPLRPYCDETTWKRENPREWDNHEFTITTEQVNLLPWVVGLVVLERAQHHSY